MSNYNYNYQKEYENIQRGKIKYFCERTGVKDYKKAEQYLNECEWDEIFAVAKYKNIHQNNNNNYYPSQNNQNYMNQFMPPTDIKHNNRPKINDDNKRKDDKQNNYLEIKISEPLLKNSHDSGTYSDPLNFISKNLKSISRTIDSFLKQLNNKGGIIIIFTEESFNRLKGQIKNINESMMYEDIMKEIVIFPALNNSPIGRELVRKLMIISFPTYIFCKYKDNKSFYVSDKMEGAFEMSFFIDCYLKISSSLENDLNLINVKSDKSKNSINQFPDIEPNLDLKASKSDVSKNHENKNNNKNNEQNNLINNLLKEKYFNFGKNNSRNNIGQNSQRNNNNNNNNVFNKNKINNNKGNENNPNYNNVNKIINEENYKNNQNINNQNINNQNYYNINEVNAYNPQEIGDFFLGDSIQFEKLLKEKYSNNNDNNYNNFNFNDYNNNLNINNNNNLYNNNNNNNNLNNNNNNLNNNFLEPNINHNSNNAINNNNDKNNNILADSIYQLSDGEILQKRENLVRELERQQEEKEKKEQEEKRKILEEENRLKNIKNNYEDESEMAKLFLPDEPDENNPNVCRIAFRIPDGEKNIERRFLKTDKIAALFNFVKSIGRDIFMEPDATDFDILCIGFPPKNLEDKKNNTLEEEGLFPNSILQIREK